MKKLDKKQKIIIEKINSILEFINEEKDWLNIAYKCSLINMEDIAGKLERIIDMLLEKKSKIIRFYR